MPTYQDETLQERYARENRIDQKILQRQTMSITIQTELIPFHAPQSVGIKQSGSHSRTQGAPAVDITAIPADVLHELCVQFRKDVFARAKKPDPLLLD